VARAIAGLFVVPHQVAVPAVRAGSAPWCLERGAGLARWGISRAPPHPQGTEYKSAEEHDNGNEQQEEQAFGDDADDA
jgi:hypothetical protein